MKLDEAKAELEEAIETLRFVNGTGYSQSNIIKAHKLAIKALERDIKVQPVLKQSEKILIGGYSQTKCWFECPDCNNLLAVGNNYCSKCGKALLPFDFENK